MKKKIIKNSVITAEAYLGHCHTYICEPLAKTVARHLNVNFYLKKALSQMTDRVLNTLVSLTFSCHFLMPWKCYKGFSVIKKVGNFFLVEIIESMGWHVLGRLPSNSKMHN